MHLKKTFFILLGYLLLCGIVHAEEQTGLVVAIEEEPEDPTIILHKPRTRRVEAPEGMKIQNVLVGEDIYERSGVFFFKEWSFKAGVTELNVPAADGWVSGLQFKGGYESFSKFAKDGDRLVSALISEDAVRSKRIGSYGDFIILLSVPTTYEYKKYNLRSFAKLKDDLKVDIAEGRQTFAERDHFENFEDYIKYKYSSDEELDTYVDGYRILAAEKDDYITYFFNTNLKVRDSREDIVKSQSVTTSIVMVRGKILKLDIRMTIYDSETYARLISFTDQFIDWLKEVNYAPE